MRETVIHTRDRKRNIETERECDRQRREEKREKKHMACAIERDRQIDILP